MAEQLAVVEHKKNKTKTNLDEYTLAASPGQAGMAAAIRPLEGLWRG